MSLRIALVRVCCVLSLSLGAPACGIVSLGGPSTVAQGKYYASGNKQFDEFFLELHRLQVRFAEAPGALAKARADLAKSANSDPASADAALADALHARFEKLIPRGIRVKIALDLATTPAASMASSSSSPSLAQATESPPSMSVSLKTSGNPGAADRELFSSVENALATLVKLRAEMQAAVPRLSELRLLAGQLDGQVDEAFDLGSARKRREVRQNLSDAVKVIGLMEERAGTVGTAAGDLSAAVAEKAGTDDGSVGLNPSPPPAPSSPTAAAAGASPEPKPARSKPAPAPRSSPAPAPDASPKPGPVEPPAPPESTPAPAPAKAKDPPKPAEFEP